MSKGVPDHYAKASHATLFERGSVKVHLEVFCKGWALIYPRASASWGLERCNLVCLVILGECLLSNCGDLADWKISIVGSEFILAVPNCPKEHGQQVDVFSFIMSEFYEV